MESASPQVVPPSERLSIRSEHRLRAENLAFDIDVWYRRLEKYTYRSTFIPLSRKEANAMVLYYRTRYHLRRDNDLSISEVDVLDSLAKRIDEVLLSEFPEGKAFVRLAGRSPKDGEPLNREAIRKEYSAALESLKAHGEEMTSNVKLRAISSIPLLKVTSAKEVLNLLLTSERVHADLIDWFDYGEPEQIVLRQFDRTMRLEHEFRAFICEGRMTALSQYDHYCHYPTLQRHKEAILRDVHTYWERMHPDVGVESYVADFLYHPDTSEVRLIELSPFMQCTGPALFSWDEPVMRSGPLTLRLLEKERQGLDSLVLQNWDKRWEGDGIPYWALCEEVSKRVPALDALSGAVSSFFAHLLPTEEPSILLFVYGTLKKGFQWHDKSGQSASFISTATTVDPFPLVVGASGVPYVLGDLPGQGKRIRGEIWRVPQESVSGLDEYEGVPKGYYSRIEVQVEMAGGERCTAFIYVLNQSAPHLRALPHREEYTMEDHLSLYHPIKHILVKQEAYLDLDHGKD